LFPLLTCACLYKRRARREAYVLTLPLWAVAGVYCFLHQTLLSFEPFTLYPSSDLYAHSAWCRFYTFIGVLPSYVHILGMPAGLHFDRNFSPITTPINHAFFAGLLIVCLSALPFFIRSQTGRVFGFGVLWFAAAHLLNTGIFVPVNAILLEHWLYMPSIGLFLAVGEGLAALRQRKGVIIGVGAVAVTLALLTWTQNHVWKNEETLYLDIFAKGEPSPHAHNNLGIFYTKHGAYDQAVAQYRLAIQLSGDQNAQAQHNLGITLLNGPYGDAETAAAIEHFKRALAIDPSFHPAAVALAELYRRRGVVPPPLVNR